MAAVQRDPFRNDAVAVVERVADGEEGIKALNLVYDILASSALGLALVVRVKEAYGTVEEDEIVKLDRDEDFRTLRPEDA